MLYVTVGKVVGLVGRRREKAVEEGSEGLEGMEGTEGEGRKVAEGTEVAVALALEGGVGSAEAADAGLSSGFPSSFSALAAFSWATKEKNK